MLPVGNRRGIPCGPYYYGVGYPGDLADWTAGLHAAPFVGGITGVLATARSLGTPLIMALAGASNTFWDPVTHAFVLANWKANIDAAAALGLSSYISDGTLIANMLIDEPKWYGTWGGEVVPNDVIDEMAAYSKTKWPTLTTLVRSSPTQLTTHAAGHFVPWPGGDYVWQYLDGAFAGMTGASENWSLIVPSAIAQNLKLVCHLYPLSDGDGSSGIPAPGYPGMWMMTAAEMVEYTATMLSSTFDCFFFTLWAYHSAVQADPYFYEWWMLPAQQEAFATIRNLCNVRGTIDPSDYHLIADMV